MGDPNFIPGQITADSLKVLVSKAFKDAEILVNDPNGNAYHFDLVVISDEFVGLSRLQQHQKIYSVLGEEFKQKLHAVTIKTFTKEAWSREGSKKIQL